MITKERSQRKLSPWFYFHAVGLGGGEAKKSGSPSARPNCFAGNAIGSGGIKGLQDNSFLPKVPERAITSLGQNAKL